MVLSDDYRRQGMRRQLAELLGRKGISDSRVLAAIAKVPRHQFIDDSAFLDLAYADQAFPIGCGQTISQPYTVAFQSQLLQVHAGEKVLEVGTGCGYQTTVLCELGAKVFSIERHRPLHLGTKQRLLRMGYKATLIYGDGYLGIPLDAPFDKIIVTCGAPQVPSALVAQLRVGGRLVVPVGPDGAQRMTLVQKEPNGVRFSDHGAFSFVPMLVDKVKG